MSFYIWEGDKFKRKDHGILYWIRRPIIKAAAVDSPPNIVTAIQTAVKEERSESIFIGLAIPSNSRSISEDGELELDEEALKNLEAMGYL